MYLTIDSSANFYELRGVLNKTNIQVFEREIEQALQIFDRLTISIENLESIDRYGVKAFSNLHLHSLNKNKRISIIGTGCKELYDHFKSQLSSGNAA